MGNAHVVNMASVGSSGAGVPGVPVLPCGGGRADMVENRNTAKEWRRL